MYFRPGTIKEGDIFGRLVVTSECLDRTKHGARRYHCQCSCGNTTIVSLSNLKFGNSTSCGCFRSESIIKRSRKPPQEFTYNWIESVYKRRAKKYKRIWELTTEQFRALITQACFFCGSPPKEKNAYINKYGKKRFAKNVKKDTAAQQWVHVNGVDRLDSSLGYIQSNCVPCCETCNYMKLDYSVNEFIANCERVIAFQRKDKK